MSAVTNVASSGYDFFSTCSKAISKTAEAGVQPTYVAVHSLSSTSGAIFATSNTQPIASA